MNTSKSRKAARKLTVILSNAPDSELDRSVIRVPNVHDPDEYINLAIHEAIDRWSLSAGDTIEIIDDQQL